MKMGSLYPALALTVLAAVLPASTNTVPLEAAFQGNKSYKDFRKILMLLSNLWNDLCTLVHMRLIQMNETGCKVGSNIWFLGFLLYLARTFFIYEEYC